MIENRRRMLMAQKKDGPIPSLKGDGKAFITLNDIVYTDRFEMTFRYTKVNKDSQIILAYQDDTHYWVIYYKSKGAVTSAGQILYGITPYWKWGVSTKPSYTSYNTQKLTMSNRQTTNWFDAVVYNEEDLTSRTVAIGTRATAYKYQYWKLFQDFVQVYSLKIWDGDTDTLKHDLVPYYMGEAGMLDLVDGTFHANESEEGSFS